MLLTNIYPILFYHLFVRIRYSIILDMTMWLDSAFLWPVEKGLVYDYYFFSSFIFHHIFQNFIAIHITHYHLVIVPSLGGDR